MSLVKVYPEVEGAVRSWLRAVPEVVALVGQRVFFAVPAEPSGWPLLTVRDVDGAVDVSEAPLGTPLIQIDCWAEGQRKADAAALKNVVVGAIEGMTAGTAMGDAAVGLWGHVISAPFAPDQVSNQARYAITAEFGVRAA